MHEIQLGANIALISCHSYGGCYTLIVRGQRRSYVQIKALRKAVCQFIHVLCGPCWQRLKTTAPSIYIRTVSKLLARDVCRRFAELVYTLWSVWANGPAQHKFLPSQKGIKCSEA